MKPINLGIVSPNENGKVHAILKTVERDSSRYVIGCGDDYYAYLTGWSEVKEGKKVNCIKCLAKMLWRIANKNTEYDDAMRERAILILREALDIGRKDSKSLMKFKYWSQEKIVCFNRRVKPENWTYHILPYKEKNRTFCNQFVPVDVEKKTGFHTALSYPGDVLNCYSCLLTTVSYIIEYYGGWFDYGGIVADLLKVDHELYDDYPTNSNARCISKCTYDERGKKTTTYLKTKGGEKTRYTDDANTTDEPDSFPTEGENDGFLECGDCIKETWKSLAVIEDAELLARKEKETLLSLKRMAVGRCQYRVSGGCYIFKCQHPDRPRHPSGSYRSCVNERCPIV